MGGGSVLDGSGTLWFPDVENAPVFLSTLCSDPQDGHQRLSEPAGGVGSSGSTEAGRPARATPTPRGAPEDFRAGPAPEA